MANTSSAKKMTRKITRRTARNKIWRSRIRTVVRKIEDALAEKNIDAAQLALGKAEPQIMQAVSRGILHRKTGARKVSRLTMQVRAAAKADD